MHSTMTSESSLAFLINDTYIVEIDPIWKVRVSSIPSVYERRYEITPSSGSCAADSLKPRSKNSDSSGGEKIVIVSNWANVK